MNHKRVEQLLRDYARLNPPKRLLSPKTAARLRAELAPGRSEGGKVDSSPEGFEPSAPGGQLGPSRRRQVLTWFVSAAAAACLLVTLLVVGYDDAARVPGLFVDGGYDEAGVFLRTTRGDPASATSSRGSFYVGVKVDRPAYVRILILDDRGKIAHLDLDRSGAEELWVAADPARVFGGYELTEADAGGVTSAIEAFLILASLTPLEPGLAGWVNKKNQSSTGPSRLEAELLARQMRERFRWAARVVVP